MTTLELLEARLVNGVRTGDVVDVEKALGEGVGVINVNKMFAWSTGSTSQRKPLLHLACEAGHLAVVELLLRHPDIDENVENEQGKKAHEGNIGNLAIVLLLFRQRGLEVNRTFGAPDKQTALMVLLQGSIFIVSQLVSERAEVKAAFGGDMRWAEAFSFAFLQARAPFGMELPAAHDPAVNTPEDEVEHHAEEASDDDGQSVVAWMTHEYTTHQSDVLCWAAHAAIRDILVTMKAILGHSDLAINLHSSKAQKTALHYAVHIAIPEFTRVLLRHPSLDRNVVDGKGDLAVHRMLEGRSVLHPNLEVTPAAVQVFLHRTNDCRGNHGNGGSPLRGPPHRGRRGVWLKRGTVRAHL